MACRCEKHVCAHLLPLTWRSACTSQKRHAINDDDDEHCCLEHAAKTSQTMIFLAETEILKRGTPWPSVNTFQANATLNATVGRSKLRRSLVYEKRLSTGSPWRPHTLRTYRGIGINHEMYSLSSSFLLVVVLASLCDLCCVLMWTGRRDCAEWVVAGLCRPRKVACSVAWFAVPQWFKRLFQVYMFIVIIGGCNGSLPRR